MYVGIHLKYLLFCRILKKLDFRKQIFEKYTKAKFHKNSYSGSRVVT